MAGALQFEVLADRIRTEYNIPVRFESTAFQTARWVDAEDPKELKRFTDKNEMAMAEDHSRAGGFPRPQQLAAQMRPGRLTRK